MFFHVIKKFKLSLGVNYTLTQKHPVLQKCLLFIEQLSTKLGNFFY